MDERRDDLVWMRQTLVDRLDAGEEAAAPLVGQLRQVVRELSELEPATGESAADVAKRKMAERRLKAVQ